MQRIEADSIRITDTKNTLVSNMSQMHCVCRIETSEEKEREWSFMYDQIQLLRGALGASLTLNVPDTLPRIFICRYGLE